MGSDEREAVAMTLDRFERTLELIQNTLLVFQERLTIHEGKTHAMVRINEQKALRVMLCIPASFSL